MAASDFLGAFLQAFSQTQLVGQQAKREDKIAKLEGQLLEEKLKAQRRQQGALSELEQRTGPELSGDLGQAGLAPGVTQGGESLLDVLSDASLAINLGVDPLEVAELRQQGQFNERILGLLGLPGGGQAPTPGAGTAEGGVTLGGQPVQFGGQAGAQSPGGFRPPRLEFGPQGTEVIFQPETPQDLLNQFRLQRERTEFQQSQGELRRERNRLKDAITDTLPNARKLAEANEILRGTFLETGQPFTALRESLAGPLETVQRAFGREVEADELRRTRVALDVFQKQAAQFGTRLIEQLQSANRITDFRAQNLRQQLADPGTTPEANAFIIADLLQEALEAIQVEELDVDARTIQEMEQLRDQLRGVASRALKPPAEMSDRELLDALGQ